MDKRSGTGRGAAVSAEDDVRGHILLQPVAFHVAFTALGAALGPGPSVDDRLITAAVNALFSR